MTELWIRRGLELSEGLNWTTAVPVIIGGALITLGVQRRSKLGWILAAAGGGVATYSLLQHQGNRERPQGRYVRRAITIGASQDQLFNFWSAPQNLKRVIPGAEDIEPSSEGSWHWRMKSPTGGEIEWDSELLEDNPPHLIHWQTTGDAPVDHHGRVEFRPAPADRGTEVELTLSWKPNGPVTQALSGLGFIGKAAGWHASEALRRAKQLIETGELSTASIGA